MHLRAARSFSNRVPVKEIILAKTGVPLPASNEESDTAWYEDFETAEFPDEFLEECNLTNNELLNQVRNLWELECLVRALDSMETLSSLAEISRE